jgi:hypothetical protein
LIIAGFFLATFINKLVIILFVLSCGSGIHREMVYSLLRAKISFYDVKSIGTIFTKFSKDMVAID